MTKNHAIANNRADLSISADISALATHLNSNAVTINAAAVAFAQLNGTAIAFMPELLAAIDNLSTALTSLHLAVSRLQPH